MASGDFPFDAMTMGEGHTRIRAQAPSPHAAAAPLPPLTCSLPISSALISVTACICERSRRCEDHCNRRGVLQPMLQLVGIAALLAVSWLLRVSRNIVDLLQARQSWGSGTSSSSVMPSYHQPSEFPPGRHPLKASNTMHTTGCLCFGTVV